MTPAEFCPDQFGIYVHWPFCAAKCPYCDFNSHVRHAAVDQARFLAAYRRELATFAAYMPGRQVTSIFFGGGTPSLMEPETVAGVLEAIAAHWPVAADAEVTLEANPSSVEAARFRGYRAAGVNRVSLGVQALNDPDLKRLGRIHDVAEARRAIALARETFPRLSFDLIYARPDQTPAAWEAELKEAIALSADHLSLYQLTIEEGTPFHALHARGRLVVPDGDRSADLYLLTQEVTAAAGLPAYEVSNHAVPGAESRHNLVYWRGAPYVGIGAGAHGRLDVGPVRVATSTERSPEGWLARVEDSGSGLIDWTPLETAEVADEVLLMGLRLREGIRPDRIAALSGRSFDTARIAALVGDGLLAELPGGRLAATAEGRMVLNALIAEIAP
ncbi:radical SAM family heme chaperone HemW [Segnochrobactraceae bacterium EtOH-i3]